MKNNPSFAKEKLKNGALALTMGALAAGVGLIVGRPTVNAVAVVAIMTSAYMLADTHGWLMKDVADDTTDRRRIYGPLALFAVLVILYMGAIDGDAGPPLAALYLPVVLAVACYKVRVGLAVSVGIAALYVLQMLTRHGGLLTARDIGALVSLPVTAIFVAGLAQRLEERFRALHSKTTELSALLDMSQMMDAAADLDTTLNLILLNVQQLSGCQVCAVYLTNPDGEMLELRAASGPRHRMALASSLSVPDAACGDWSLKEAAHRNGEEFVLYAEDMPSALARCGGSHLFDLDRRAASFACAPLASVDGLLGLLYLGFDQAHGLPAEARARLGPLAVRAAFSLQRAVLQQGFRSLAYSDAMTGLDNFRQFEQHLGSELRRAERYDRALSVILLDIDHFKTFNDTLGHQAGDALLAQLATVLRDSLRSVDKPARYGGEEFVVVCPETGKDEARLIAERIRRSVEQTTFALLGQSEPSGTTHVTVSVGCATFPYDAASARDLVKAADDALYAAKHAGRNAVRSHDDVPAPTDQLAA